MGSQSHLVRQGIYMRQDTATISNYDYGTLSLTTGAFTKIAASPVDVEGSLARPPRIVNNCFVGRRCSFPAYLRMAAAVGWH